MADISTLVPVTVPYDAVHAILPAGGYSLDVALAASPRWHGVTAAGTPLTLSYFFSDVPPQYAQLPPGYAPANALAWASLQERTVENVLSEYSKVANITFVRAVRPSDADLGFYFTRSMSSDQYVPVPGSVMQKGTPAGDIFVAYQDLFQPFRIFHDVAHALGLVDLDAAINKPGIDSLGLAPSRLFSLAEQDWLPKPWYLVDDSLQIGIAPLTEASGPMLLDILALQLLYGANTSTAAGDDRYRFDVNPTIYKTIWDAGGYDIIDVSNQTNSSYVTLVPGTYSSIGLRDPFAGFPPEVRPYATNFQPDMDKWYDGTNNLVIAFGATIEDAIGSAADDVLIGNDVSNRLIGGGGNDRLDGGAGIDFTDYIGTRAQYAITKTANGFQVASAVDGTDQLIAVERIGFADIGLALDIDGNAGKVARILGAVFGADSIANEDYVATALSLLDAGLSYEAVAQIAVTATRKSDYADIVNLLWTNVMGTQIPADALALYQGLLASGMSVGELVTLAADTSQNLANIDIVGLSASGLEYSLI
jgi:serralysin